VAAVGALFVVLPPGPSQLWYYTLLAGGSTPRIAALAGVGCALALPVVARAGRLRWLSWSALALGAASAGVSAALTIPVFRAARSLGHSISVRQSLFGGSDDLALDPALVTFSATDGWHLDADIYRPLGSVPRFSEDGRGLPAVVIVHGGAWRHGDKGENVAWNQRLVERGFVIVDIQYRLAPETDWRGAVDDIWTAMAWLRTNARELNVDPDRVALLGRSAGAHLALLAAYSNREDDAQTPPTAVVALYAPTDLGRLYGEASAGSGVDLRDGLHALLGGPPIEHTDVYRQASPITNVHSTVPPTLLIHGTWDEVVPPAHTQLLSSALSSVGARVETLMIPHARHSFDLIDNGPATQLAREVVVAFLERTLGHG
jgi:acetyl esterase/lipase